MAFGRILGSLSQASGSSFSITQPSVRAIVCPEDAMLPVSQSYWFNSTNTSIPHAVISAGSDKHIRFWSLNQPSKNSYTITGVEQGQSVPVYSVRNNTVMEGKLGATAVFLCHEHNLSKTNLSGYHKLYKSSFQTAKQLESETSLRRGLSQKEKRNQSPTSERRGLVPPSSAHEDCILDIKFIQPCAKDSPHTSSRTPLLVSAARDGVVKVW
eukprot:CAMPEP_0184012956 /NCGR_PEP_ID=MMETSP0954-20121128/4737_1 /TAXON_ID=627963 /ORGANISM="Aplanochytrium sp, Strain PBS07" /LENGTH=211 /DNA_ID=CAMNT_0026293075 /DNA_START=252 /DNA_END=884 /DNA_ORIENTATION=-